MKTVNDYESLSAAITACFRPGVDTNCTLKADALRREIASGILQVHQWQGGLLLLRNRGTHQVLNYYRTDPSADLDLCLPARTVVEIPVRPGREADTVWWGKQDFRLVEHRLRLTRPAVNAEPEQAAAELSAEKVLALLQACFVPETGCLPTLEELESDLREHRLLTAGNAGVLRFDNSRVAEIRHLAVSADARGKGIGTALLNRFNGCTADRTARVWTGVENHTARRLYEKAGFAADGWQSIVLMND